MCAGVRKYEIADLAEKISAMHKQERVYMCDDYIGTGAGKVLDCVANTENTGCATKPSGISEIDRSAFCSWFYQLVDYLGVRRELVAIAMSCLDRFLSKATLLDRRYYKIVASASLRLTVKVHEPNSLNLLNVLPQLNKKGDFGMQHIAAMELLILRALTWLVNPPTSLWRISSASSPALRRLQCDQKYWFYFMRERYISLNWL